MSNDRHTSPISHSVPHSLLFIFFILAALVTSIFATEVSAAEQLNINKANASQIESHLPGIGKVKAQAIVDYRDRHGPFDGPEQLLKIKGVGPHTLDRIRPLINFNGVRDQFFSQVRQQSLDDRDQAIRQEIKRIVTRARQAATQ